MENAGRRAGLYTSATLKHASLIALALLAVFPLYWMIVTSLKPETEVFTSSLIPLHWTLDNYIHAWNAIPMRTACSS